MKYLQKPLSSWPQEKNMNVCWLNLHSMKVTLYSQCIDIWRIESHLALVRLHPNQTKPWPKEWNIAKMQKKIFLIEVSLTNTAAHFRSKKLNLHRTVHFCTLLMDKSETYFLNGQQSKSLRLQLFTCFQSQQRITGRVYSEWPTLIIWPTFSLKINNFCVLFFAIFVWYSTGYFTLGDTLLMSCFFNVNSDPPL